MAPGPQHQVAHVDRMWLRLGSCTQAQAGGYVPPHPLLVVHRAHLGAPLDPPLQHVPSTRRGT